MAKSHPQNFREHLDAISIEYYDAIYLMRPCEPFKGYAKDTDEYFEQIIRKASRAQLEAHKWKIGQIKSQQIIIQNKIATYDLRARRAEMPERDMKTVNQSLIYKCPHCKEAYVVLIFTGQKLGRQEIDPSVFDAHIEKTQIYVAALGVPAFIISSGQDVADSEVRSWRMQIWPKQMPPQYMNDYEFGDSLDPILWNHCDAAKRAPRLMQWRAEQSGDI